MIDKHALIIGADKESKDDVERWDAYSKQEGFHWHGLTSHIPNRERVNPKLIESKPDKILEAVVRTYDKIYDEIIAEISQKQRKEFDLIMVDRQTTHCLFINNPLPGHYSNKEENILYYQLVKNGYLDDADLNPGTFNKRVMCLLLAKMLSLIKIGGTLIFDTALMDKDDVEFVGKFFSKTQSFDYTADNCRILDYQSAPTSKNSRYIKFAGLISHPSLAATLTYLLNAPLTPKESKQEIVPKPNNKTPNLFTPSATLPTIPQPPSNSGNENTPPKSEGKKPGKISALIQMFDQPNSNPTPSVKPSIGKNKQYLNNSIKR